MTDVYRNDFNSDDDGATRFGWWKTVEHFCAPDSQPEAISRVRGLGPESIQWSRGLVQDDLREHTAKYTRKPVIAVDYGDGWRYAYKAQKYELVDSRITVPDQPPKYDRVRNRETTVRGNLGPVPPRAELEIIPRDLVDPNANESLGTIDRAADATPKVPSNTAEYGFGSINADLPRDGDVPDANETSPVQAVGLQLGEEIERRYAERVVWQRLHQPKLRMQTLQHHGTACTYCGLDIPQIVEAAHLVADSEGGAASVDNMRPMCPNHHRAYDAGLLAWDGRRFKPTPGAPSVGPDPGPS